MSPVPSLPSDLHYADSDQVELDLDAIIAQGGRIRRRRLIAKAAAVAVVWAVAPMVIVTDVVMQAPGIGPDNVAGQMHSGPNALRTYNGGTARKQAGWVFGPAASPGSGGIAGATYQPDFAMASVDRKLSATVPHRLGPVLAMASTRSADGVWFAAASSQLTLFHLSDQGKLTSVPLARLDSSLPATAGLGLAVSSSGVVWVRVSAALIRYDPRISIVSYWQVPALQNIRPPPRNVYSVAVAPDGSVAVASSASSSVQVLNPRTGTFSYYALPAAADRPLAVGYARDGTLGVGYLHRSLASKVMLVKPSGERLTATVAQSTAVMSYGQSGLLVGAGRPDVVSATGKVRPLTLPAGIQPAPRDAPPPVSLPGGRMGLAYPGEIVTFPARAASVVAASRQAKVWLVQQDRCPRDLACPVGFRMVAADGSGEVWATPEADPYSVVLLLLG
jgi:hypothetical protein